MAQLIKIYNENNGIKNIDDMDFRNVTIPLYIQRLFYFAVDELRKRRDNILIIKWEWLLMVEALQNELVVFNDDDGLCISGFLRCLEIGEKQMKLMRKVPRYRQLSFTLRLQV